MTAINTMVTRDEALAEIHKTEGFDTREFQCGVVKTGFRQDKEGKILFRLERDEFPMTKDAFVKAARICGIPESYILKFPDEDLGLVTAHLDYWFKHRDDDLRVFIAPAGDMVTAFTKATVDYYSRLELFELAEHVVSPDSLDGLLYDKVYNTIDGGLHYTIVSHKNVQMPKDVIVPGTHNRVNDVLRGGIHVQDHLLGELPLMVTADVFRLVCSNGMISVEAVQKWSRRNDATNVKEWFEVAVGECYGAIEAEFAKVQRLDAIKLEDHGAEVLKGLFAEFKVGTKARVAIMDNVVNEQAETLYDVFNAITYAANDEELADSPLAIRNLQSVAGGVATHPAFCPFCYRVLS